MGIKKKSVLILRIVMSEQNWNEGYMNLQLRVKCVIFLLFKLILVDRSENTCKL